MAEPLFGVRLRSARIKAGMTGRALARRAGVAESLVSHLETSKTDPLLSTAVALARALGLTLDQLLSRRDRAA